MRRIILISFVFVLISNSGFSIDPNKYSLGMDYEGAKKAIFDELNFVTWFDESTIAAVAQDPDYGQIELSFANGKIKKILISGVLIGAFKIYTDWINKLTQANASLVSWRAPLSEKLGAAYLWKVDGSEVELGLFLNKEGKVIFQILKKLSD